MMAKKKQKKKTELAGARVKLSFKKHLLPPLVGIFVFAAIFGFFDSNLLSGKVAYSIYSGRIKSLQYAAPKAVSGGSRIIIGRIGVNAPVNFSETNPDEANLLRDLRNGTVHYPQTALPGHEGNMVIFGHSSDDWWAAGNYKYVFCTLNKLGNNDLIYIDYKGTRYTYRVYDAKLVDPNRLTVLNQGSSYILTLITSAPAGTDSRRLIIRATQVAPAVHTDIAFDKAASQPAVPAGILPGNSGPFWHDFKERF